VRKKAFTTGCVRGIIESVDFRTKWGDKAMGQRRRFAGFIGTLAVLALLARTAAAAPAQVIIIRHAEKPDTGNQLNERGFQRANALVDFFEHAPAVTKYGTPAAIYAMAPKGPDGSVRPIQTVTPLAKDLGLAIKTPYQREQLDRLVQDIMGNPDYQGRMVLICWEHKVIPEMAQDFGGTSAPDFWAGEVFDRAWILNFTGDRVTSFQDAPEHVLPGDSAQ